MKKKRWTEARDLLEELDRHSPGQPDVLTNLVNAYYELRDLEGYQHAAERLIKVAPDNADLALGLAGAYLGNTRVTLSPARLPPLRAALTRSPARGRSPSHRRRFRGGSAPTVR